MALTYKIIQSNSGGVHSALIISDNFAQTRVGVAHWDPARGNFAFSPDNPNLVLSSADQGALVSILNGLSR